MSRLRAALPLLLLVVTGIILLASGGLDRLHLGNMASEQTQLHLMATEHPWLTRLGYIGLLTMAVATGVPGTVVIIFAGGLIFGVVDGTIVSSVALTLGSLLLFLASRYAFGAGSQTPPALVSRLRHRFATHPVSYTLFLRFIPVIPFGGVTIALAWLRCPMWLFMGATWLGGTVSLIFETSVGAGLGGALSHGQSPGIGLLLDKQVLMPLGALALLALVPLALNALRSKFSHKR